MVVDEEKIPGYDWKTFYHPNPGDMLAGKYELKAKVGWGSSSTVWLARDTTSLCLLTTYTNENGGWLQDNEYYAIKINANNYSENDAQHELKTSRHLAAWSTEHRGKGLLVTAVDHFEINSPRGSHICLVFDAMREPIWIYRRRFGDDKVTQGCLPLFKRYIKALLYALDYLHSERHIIHTDLKFLVTIEDESILERFVEGQFENPMPRKVMEDHTVYLCHNDFGEIKREHLRGFVAKIADFGLSQRGDGPGPLMHPIQPAHCHAPEVMLGLGWSYSADIWNFGVMVWDLLAGRQLFEGRSSDSEPYSAGQHLAEMVAFIGPIPPRIIQREREHRHWCWSPEIPNEKGKLCNNAADYFEGPFFSHSGEFLYDTMVPSRRSMEKERPDCISKEDFDIFHDFMTRMLRWVPEERATAKELIDHPWLAPPGS